jgi:hypothetical protein
MFVGNQVPNHIKLQPQHTNTREVLFAIAAVGTINTADRTQVSEEQGGSA